MLLPFVFAAATVAQESQPVATSQAAVQAPPASVIAAPPGTPAQAPEPSPLAGALKSRPEAAASAGVTRYDPSFFAAFRPNTALDMVTRLPGFDLQLGAGVRGFSGAAGNILVDGDRPTTKQDDLQSLLKRIPAVQVDHIDIIRGGAPGIDMQGQTVIANVVRRSKGGVTGLVGIEGQLFSHDRQIPSIRFEGSKRWDDGRSLEASFVGGDFVDDGTDNGSRTRYAPDGTVIQRANVVAQAGGDQENFTVGYSIPAWGGKFRINGSLQLQTYKDNEDDSLSFPNDQVGALSVLRDRQTKLQSELGLHWEKTLASKWTIETIFLQQYNTQGYDSHFYDSEDDLFHEADTGGETIGRVVMRYKHSDKLQAEFAAEGAYNWLSTATTFAVDEVPQSLPAASVAVNEKRGEVSGQATWRPSSKLTVEGGMRVELSTIASSGDVDLTKTLAYPKPRVLVTWSPTKNDQFRIRGEREVGQLNFSDFVATSALSTGQVQAGNPNLTPQTDWVVEGAYERHFLGSADAVITARHLFIQNAVDRVPFCDDTGENCFDSPGNIGAGEETDLLFSLTLPLDKIGLKHALLKGTGTYRRSEVIDPTTGEHRRISGQHPFDYEAHFSQDIPKLKITWGVDVFNRWTETYYRFNEVDRYALKTFAVAYVKWKPDPTLSIQFEVDNLGGRGFERTIYAYDGPRNISPLQYIDDRELDDHPSALILIRKTLG